MAIERIIIASKAFDVQRYLLEISDVKNTINIYEDGMIPWSIHWKVENGIKNICHFLE